MKILKMVDDAKRKELELDKAIDDYYVEALVRSGRIVQRFNQGTALDCESGTLVSAVFEKIAKDRFYLEQQIRIDEQRRKAMESKVEMEKH